MRNTLLRDVMHCGGRYVMLHIVEGMTSLDQPLQTLPVSWYPGQHDPGVHCPAVVQLEQLAAHAEHPIPLLVYPASHSPARHAEEFVQLQFDGQAVYGRG